MRFEGENVSSCYHDYGYNKLLGNITEPLITITVVYRVLINVICLLIMVSFSYLNIP